MDENKFVQQLRENGISPESLKSHVENVQLSRRGLLASIAASAAVPKVLEAGGNDFIPDKPTWEENIIANFGHAVSC